MDGAIVHASSADLGWAGLYAEVGTNTSWEVEDVSFDGDYLAINLGNSPIRILKKDDDGAGEQILPPGSLWIHPAGASFSMAVPGQRVEYGGILFDRQWTARLRGHSLPPRIHYNVEDPVLEHLTRALLAEMRGGGLSGPLLVESLATATIARIDSLSPPPIPLPAIPPPSSAGPQLSSQSLARVLEYIDANLAQPVSLEELAGVAHTSIFHFSRLFKKSTGRSPHQFLVHKRIEKAQSLLTTNSHLSLAEIALACGFYDQSHMNHHFRRHLGQSPAALRPQPATVSARIASFSR